VGTEPRYAEARRVQALQDLDYTLAGAALQL
jgi:hypothetical protein